MPAWRRWERWAALHGLQGRAVFEPTGAKLGAFFLEVSAGGPTAAATCWSGLRWWATRLGLANFPLESLLVADFRLQTEGHKARQAEPLDLALVPHLVFLARAGQGARSTFAGFVLMLLSGCIRYRHLQRSIFKGADAAFLTAECVKGKSRRKGVRPGYTWSSPRSWGPEKDVLAGVIALQGMLRAKG